MDIKQVREYFKQSVRQHIDDHNADYLDYVMSHYEVEDFDALDETIDFVVDCHEEQIIDMVVKNALFTGLIYQTEGE